MAEAVRLLTYDEIASIFGITRESARQLVIRKRWGRTKGNDNRARIEVPEDAITGASTSDDMSAPPSDDTGHDPSDDPSDRTSDFAAVVALLERHAGRLEVELAAARSRIEAVETERDAERVKAGQVATLEAVLEIERLRLAEARADADRARVEAERWREAASAPRSVWATILKRFG